MKKYAVLVTSYPTEKEPATVGFVHSRVKEYIKNGLCIEVLKISNVARIYDIEGVHVISGSIEELLNILEKVKYTKILVHFLVKAMDPIIKQYPTIVWVHGVEALHWKRRLFNLSWKFPKYIIDNQKQLKYFKSVVKNKKDMELVFVSNWMHNIAEIDMKIDLNKYMIIPNFIDTDFFDYVKKDLEQRKKILIVRSFSSKKYANDISVKVIKALAQKNFFNDLQITIYGEGDLFLKTIKPLRKYSNISINNRFLNHYEIRNEYKKYGIFLCPTRQDAQGVSMCEAMSSGCVPITSLNTAIPEFVDSNSGIMCDNKIINSFVDAICKLQDQEIFEKMSRSAREKMLRQCNYNESIVKEIEIITQ